MGGLRASVAALVVFGLLDVVVYALVLELMRAGNADFACQFTCTVGESVGHGLLRLTRAAAYPIVAIGTVLGPVWVGVEVRRVLRRPPSDGPR